MFNFEKLEVWRKAIEFATGSLFEVDSQSVVARRQGFLSDLDYSSLYTAAEEQNRILSGLRKSVIADQA